MARLEQFVVDDRQDHDTSKLDENLRRVMEAWVVWSERVEYPINLAQQLHDPASRESTAGEIIKKGTHTHTHQQTNTHTQIYTHTLSDTHCCRRDDDDDDRPKWRNCVLVRRLDSARIRRVRMKRRHPTRLRV